MKKMILLCLLLLSPAVHAQSMCAIDDSRANIRFVPITPLNINQTQYGSIGLNCNGSYAYDIQLIEVGQGGRGVLRSGNNELSVFFRKSYNKTPLGAPQFRESWTGTSIGGDEWLDFEATLNTDPFPPAGVYRGDYTIRIVF